MHHKQCLLTLVGLFLICSPLAEGDSLKSQGVAASASDPPFIIHYGLNDSHGRSWVCENGLGVVGVTYFERFEGSADEGILKHKTIMPDGSKASEIVTTGQRLEKSVLLYDAQNEPHIFVARSNEVDQVIDHYFKDNNDQWQSETIIHFNNEGGKFIYELSADRGPDYSFHLLLLKSRSDVDSDDFMDAWINSYLYHLTNQTGSWEKELVHNYDMPYTYDMCIKSSIRQDMKVDDDGYIHVAFGVQISGSYDPSRLMYATNKSGTWQIETALSNIYGPVDDAGWFPSLCLDNDGVPHIACIYLNRVLTHSVTYSKLLLLKRVAPGNWSSAVVAEYDDGYYGADGRDYTGALCHLVFDTDNTPHIVFSDIAATHWDWQRLNVGNIRYGVYRDGAWDLTTIYRQPLPEGFFDAIEMLWMCLVVSEQTGTVHVIGQEIEVTGEGVYTCDLLEFAWPKDPTPVIEESGGSLPDDISLSQNYPNPFNPGTSITFDLPRRSRVTLTVFNLLGQLVNTLVCDELPAGSHSIAWDGIDQQGKKLPTGVYFYRLETGNTVQSKKMLLLK
ncbi:MAG: T9SS type A sorting domain-containing protein [Candidatus Zixiibacteriota bacterium]|nr:MAG: T9SS type A sorting domain-containing protein [candidate division Zixibacteria bacterium]